MVLISYGAPIENLLNIKSKQFKFLDIGASIKIISHSLQEYSAFGIGLDIGVKYIPLKTVKPYPFIPGLT